MIFAFLATVAVATQTSPTAGASVLQACQTARLAMQDALLASNALWGGGDIAPSSLGREFLKARDRLSVAMKAETPDLELIGRLWRDVDRLQLQIAQQHLVSGTECRLEKLKVLPSDAQKKELRRLAPQASEERARIRVAPPAPPPPPPASPKKP
jgi:hypothetical protein